MHKKLKIFLLILSFFYFIYLCFLALNGSGYILPGIHINWSAYSNAEPKTLSPLTTIGGCHESCYGTEHTLLEVKGTDTTNIVVACFGNYRNNCN